MLRPTAAPLVLALGLALAAAGWITSVALIVVGAGIAIFGLGSWITELLPGRGHVEEELVDPARRARPAEAQVSEQKNTEG